MLLTSKQICIVLSAHAAVALIISSKCALVN